MRTAFRAFTCRKPAAKCGDRGKIYLFTLVLALLLAMGIHPSRAQSPGPNGNDAVSAIPAQHLGDGGNNWIDSQTRIQQLEAENSCLVLAVVVLTIAFITTSCLMWWIKIRWQNDVNLSKQAWHKYIELRACTEALAEITSKAGTGMHPEVDYRIERANGDLDIALEHLYTDAALSEANRCCRNARDHLWEAMKLDSQFRTSVIPAMIRKVSILPSVSEYLSAS